MDGCWRCGAPWRCSTCGSFERRKGGKGCAECHRRSARRRTARKQTSHPGLTVAESALFCQLLADDFEDVEITPAAGAYVAAFDEYLTAQRSGDPAARRAAQHTRRTALAALEGPVSRHDPAGTAQTA